MNAKFCRECGIEIPNNASFCPGCGREVISDDEENFNVKVSDTSRGKEHSLEEQWDGSGKFQKLIVFLWISFFFSLASTAVGCFDIREYYSLGRVGNLIFSFLFHIWDLWLIVAMMHRKSWARKSFIAITLLFALGEFLTFSDFENLFVKGLNLLCLILDIYCVFLCFGKEVIATYLPDSKVRGARATVNRYHCIFYWSYFLVILAIFIGYMIARQNVSADWLEDCKKAAINGSVDAKGELIDKYAEKYAGDTTDENKIAEAYDKATQEIDKFLKDNQKNSSSSLEDALRKFSKSKPAMYFLTKGTLKGIAKALVAVFILVGAFISQRKKD